MHKLLCVHEIAMLSSLLLYFCIKAKESKTNLIIYHTFFRMIRPFGLKKNYKKKCAIQYLDAFRFQRIKIVCIRCLSFIMCDKECAMW